MGRHEWRKPVVSRREDDTTCTVLHVDLDAFYATASLIEHPHLRGRPVIVGGQGRGVVLCATYEARRYGVHAAMPMSQARRRCPDAVVLAPDFDLYQSISASVMSVLKEISPLVEPLGLDEAFVDVAGAVRRLGSPRRIAQTIRDRVADEQGVTCSVGLAPVPFVAKIASDLAKPDGMVVVPASQVVDFLHQLPVAALWGVGEKTAAALERLGLRSIAEVAHTPRETLIRGLGEGLGGRLHDLAWGREHRRIAPVATEHSASASETFGNDVDDPEVMRRQVLALSARVGERIRRAGQVGSRVTLSVRFSDFTTVTRSRSLGDPTDVTREIYDVAVQLLDALALQRARVRRLGVSVERLTDRASTPRQLRLDEPERGWRDVEVAMDRASGRFGRGAVRPAALVAHGRRADRERHGAGRRDNSHGMVVALEEHATGNYP